MSENSASAARSQLCMAYGLTLRTFLDIPGALPIDDDRPVPKIDIVVTQAPVCAEGDAIGPYRLAPGALIFEAPGVARFRCDAASIMVERIDGAENSAVAGFLIATALPACLWMRGEIVLHAAAVLLPGATRAMAIMGDSGSGKSTLLHALVGAGASVLADDTLCVRATADGVDACGLPGGYFLGDSPRIFHPVGAGRRLASAQLSGAIVLQMPRATGGAAIRRLSPLEAFQALLANRHRPRIPALLGLHPALVGPIAALAGRLPIHALQRREGALRPDPEEWHLLSRD